MIFTPLMTRRATSAPRPSGVALQRFLIGALQARPAARPAGVTVTRDDKATTLQLDVPGLAREQLQITIEGKQVQVQSMEGAPRQVRRARCAAPGSWQKTSTPPPARRGWSTACSR